MAACLSWQRLGAGEACRQGEAHRERCFTLPLRSAGRLEAMGLAGGLVAGQPAAVHATAVAAASPLQCNGCRPVQARYTTKRSGASRDRRTSKPCRTGRPWPLRSAAPGACRARASQCSHRSVALGTSTRARAARPPAGTPAKAREQGPALHHQAHHRGSQHDHPAPPRWLHDAGVEDAPVPGPRPIRLQGEAAARAARPPCCTAAALHSLTHHPHPGAARS